ncbi:hypothetical protein TrCOL_g449 [Triparma columacea]|jgi:GTPase SAR1 family protein|uniref:Uncharacterized protein n=1 Tax=Triparma columacea TaxID=722753 RepID=A0A9W7GMV1_9STRA|nr:hypothetical protein TrCOL_g449 [Triparma columacea]
MSIPTTVLTLVGNGSVGKTSIINRFQDDGFAKQYKQTVGCDFFEKTVEFRGSMVKCTVWDIGGQSLSSKNLSNYVVASTVLFLCYDVTDPQSFADLSDWLTMVRRAFDEQNASITRENEEQNKTLAAIGKRPKNPKLVKLPAMYLVGNKIDLIAHRRVQEREHASFITGEDLSGGFFMSAQSGENVLTVFYKVAAQSIGIELTEYELEFTKKVLSVSVGKEAQGKMKGSEAIEKEDQQAHEDVLNMLKGGGGGGGGCSNKCSVC